MNRNHSSPLLPQLLHRRWARRLRSLPKNGRQTECAAEHYRAQETSLGQGHPARARPKGAQNARLPIIQETGPRENMKLMQIQERTAKDKIEQIAQSLKEDEEARKTTRIQLLNIQRELTETEQQLETVSCRRSSLKPKTLLRTYQDLEAYNTQKSQLTQEFASKATQLAMLLSSLKQELHACKSELFHLDSTVKSQKKELNSLQATQLAHYKGLLKEGIDTRIEGLAWVILTL